MIAADSKNHNPAGFKGWCCTIEEGITVHWISVPYSNKMDFGDRIKAFLKFSLAASWKASTIAGDVVFATSTPLTVAIPALFASWRRDVPMVFEVRDLWPEVPIAMGVLRNSILIALSRMLESIAYKKASQIVALSPGMKKGIARASIDENKIHVIPNAADVALFDVPESEGVSFRNQHAWLGHRALVVYVGTLGKANGVGYLVKLASVAKARDPEIRFLIVGDGKERAEIEALAKGLGVLGENLFMMASIPKKDVPRVLAAATMAASTFIDVPALWDNSANKVFDALAAGRPVAINYQGWQADFLRESGAGIVLKVDDIDASAKMLTDALHDPTWLASAGRAAKTLAVERFSRDRLAIEIENVLIRAIAYDGTKKSLR
jgi:glycosyltransferase involved in cell wall biosynthesis